MEEELESIYKYMNELKYEQVYIEKEIDNTYKNELSYKTYEKMTEESKKHISVYNILKNI
jgi:hypothetical protein